MVSVAQSLGREDSESEFVGQVLMRKSPVLTWRPALAASLRDDDDAGKNPARGAGRRVSTDSSLRISRAPTRRVVAWPVVKHLVRHSRAETAWAIAVRVAGGAAVVAVLAVVAMTAWPREAGLERSVATRARVAHVVEESRDALVAPVAVTAAVAPAPPRSTAPQAHEAAPAPALRADHAAHHARRPARRAQR